jgi:hypothetical protein
MQIVHMYNEQRMGYPARSKRGELSSFPFQSQETRGIFREKSPNHQRETNTEATMEVL